jgi:hypothetical protein
VLTSHELGLEGMRCVMACDLHPSSRFSLISLTISSILTTIRELVLEAGNDHVRQIAREADPTQAVIELIWNGLDAEANRVSVSIFELNSIARPGAALHAAARRGQRQPSTQTPYQRVD